MLGGWKHGRFGLVLSPEAETLFDRLLQALDAMERLIQEQASQAQLPELDFTPAKNHFHPFIQDASCSPPLSKDHISFLHS